MPSSPDITDPSEVERTYHHGHLREALIEQAIVSVDAVGSEHVSLRSVAAAVGVSPSAAYHHFADKDELIEAVRDRGFDQLNEFVLTQVDREIRDTIHSSHEQTVASESRIDQLALMRAGALSYVSFAVDHPHLFATMFAGIGAPVKPAFLEKSVGTIVTQLIEDRGFSSNDGRMIETVLLASVHGIASLVVEGRLDRSEVPHAIDTLGRIILGSLADKKTLVIDRIEEIP